MPGYRGSRSTITLQISITFIQQVSEYMFNLNLHDFISHFRSVKDICAALSSTSLPKLKKKFLKTSSGLPIIPFTEVLFKQLHESYPKIVDEDEASHLIALIEELFNQIG
jgi:DNA-binding LytR/AlgR family response regulator